MESQPTQDNRPVNPRRRKRTKQDVFRETYLPFLIVAVAVLAIVGIIVGIIAGVRGSDSPSETTNRHGLTQEEQQAKDLLKQAEKLAVTYDYDGALKVLETFDGDVEDHPKIKEAIASYTLAKSSMIPWQAEQVPNLSFHTLIADLEAALADGTYGQAGNNKYNRNFITTMEFTTILQQLYDHDYVLVDLSDLYTYQEDDKTYVAKELLLPAGKKPIILTETHCNYYSYMEESHGFASKLLYSDDGFYNEMTTSGGSTVSGNFDFVPLLEHFIEKHPDFSYKGARAVLAFSGYDGIFGYRITSDTLSQEVLAQEQEAAASLVKALQEAGYTLACYTYANTDYSVKNAQAIQEDIRLWQGKIAPVVGQTDILVFAQEADIGTSYHNNEKFDVLYNSGFHYFLGSAPILSCEVEQQYVRHNRLMVTASNLAHHADWFEDILDTSNLLDSLRGNIPE